MKTDKTRPKKQEDQDMEIPGMDLDTNYTSKKPILPEGTEKLQKEMEKTKKEFDKIKAVLLKKYHFIQAIGIIAPQAVKLLIEDELGEGIQGEELEKLQKKNHLYIMIPEEKFKEIPKIKKEMIAEIEKIKKDVWIYLKTPVDVWEACLDSKFEIVAAIGMSYPLYDTGFLGVLRLAEIHKALVLQKFDKYIVSYVVGGSFVRGEATKTSDADVFIIINDTDVKRMPRVELRERLRTMIAGTHLEEAIALAGVRNTLHIQTYLLTDFWEYVKDAHPVMFTFIRDGIPLYDRGTFLPWKALLKMGRLRPSPEAIDMFMKTAEKTKEMADRRLVDVMIDLYYSVLNPSQALIMLSGSPPPTHKETPSLMEKIFVDKEKLITKADIKIVDTVVKAFKAYEHDPKYKISGKEIDSLLKDTEVYLGKLKELRKKIEKRSQENTIIQIHKDIFNLLEAIFGKKKQSDLVMAFGDLVKQGKFTQNHLKILNDVIHAQAEFKKGKLDSMKVDDARKNASILISDLIDYSQKADLMTMEKGRMRLKYTREGKPANAELLNCNHVSFLFMGQEIKKITDKIENSNMNEVSAAMADQKASRSIDVDPKVFEILRKELGNFEIIL